MAGDFKFHLAIFLLYFLVFFSLFFVNVEQLFVTALGYALNVRRFNKNLVPDRRLSCKSQLIYYFK